MESHAELFQEIERPSITLASRMQHLESHVFNVLGLQFREHEARINSIGEMLEEIRAGQPPRTWRLPALGSRPLSHLPEDAQETWQDRRRRRLQDELEEIDHSTPASAEGGNTVATHERLEPRAEQIHRISTPGQAVPTDVETHVRVVEKDLGEFHHAYLQHITEYETNMKKFDLLDVAFRQHLEDYNTRLTQYMNTLREQRRGVP